MSRGLSQFTIPAREITVLTLEYLLKETKYERNKISILCHFTSKNKITTAYMSCRDKGVHVLNAFVYTKTATQFIYKTFYSSTAIIEFMSII